MKYLSLTLIFLLSILFQVYEIFAKSIESTEESDESSSDSSSSQRESTVYKYKDHLSTNGYKYSKYTDHLNKFAIDYLKDQFYDDFNKSFSMNDTVESVEKNHVLNSTQYTSDKDNASQQVTPNAKVDPYSESTNTVSDPLGHVKYETFKITSDGILQSTNYSPFNEYSELNPVENIETNLTEAIKHNIRDMNEFISDFDNDPSPYLNSIPAVFNISNDNQITSSIYPNVAEDENQLTFISTNIQSLSTQSYASSSQQMINDQHLSYTSHLNESTKTDLHELAEETKPMTENQGKSTNSAEASNETINDHKFSTIKSISNEQSNIISTNNFTLEYTIHTLLSTMDKLLANIRMFLNIN